MRAHGDEIATNHSFLDVLLSDDQNHTHSSTIGRKSKLVRLRDHCLEPGRYSMYMQRWLQVFPAYRMLLVDGEVLITHPSQVMTSVQKFLGVTVLNYNKKLR